MIVVGEPGSGKTRFVLERLEEAIRTGHGDRTLLVTPTASMTRHLAHELARSGLAVPDELVVPIKTLVERLTPSLKEPPPVIDSWLFEEAVAQTGGRAFGELRRSAGLLRRARSAIDDLQTANCSPEQAKHLARSAHQHGLAAAYRAYLGFLDTYEFVTAPQRRIAAAQAAAIEGVPGKESVYFDGFWDYSAVELDLIRSLRNRGGDVQATATPQAARLFSDWSRTELAKTRRAAPRQRVVAAAGLDQEIEEVARSIVSANRPWREIGVLLRAPDDYVPTIDAVFGRFGIPFRARRAKPLGAHPAAVVIRELLSASAEGFPGERTLDTVRRPAFRGSADSRFDHYDFEMQRRLPGRGSDLFDHRAPGVIREMLEELPNLQERRLSPRDWAGALQKLQGRLLAPALPADGLPAPQVLEQRGWGQALTALHRAAQDAAELLEFRSRQECDFSEYAAAFARALDCTELAVGDERRDVVNVLSAHEARQWELPVVFVCGMVEGSFPAELPDDLFFPEQERRRLEKRGVPLRSMADRMQAEQLLFDIASSRANEELVFTYPEADGTGAPLLRSFFLAGDGGEDVTAAPARPREQPSPGPAPSPNRLGDAASLMILRGRHSRFSPSGLESFIQCPYAFFADHALRLKERPAGAVERLDARECGSIIHATLAEWSADSSRPVGEILHEVFTAKLAELHLQPGFRTIVIEDALRRDLERFVQEPLSKPLPGAERGGLEQEVGYLMECGPHGDTRVRGHADRYDTVGSDAAVVIDYKHSAPGRVKSLVAAHEAGTKLQGALYLKGLEDGLGLEPAGMLFCSLKDETTVGGWVREGLFRDEHVPQGVEVVPQGVIRGVIDRGVAAAAEAGAEIRDGKISVEPEDRGYCERLCSFSSVCRIEL